MAVAKAKSKPSAIDGVPDVGRILKRLRTQRNLSIREVAEASELSPSFISAVERNDSDLSLGRLARIARFFDLDIGTLLGYSTNMNRPRLLPKSERAFVNRGKGVKYERLRLPGFNLDLILVTLEPHSALRNPLAHEGIECMICTEGELIIEVDDVDYPLHERDCLLFTGTLPHRVRNDSRQQSSCISLTTGRM